MRRHLLAGLGLASALTLVTGVVASAEPRTAEPGAALEVQADQRVDQTVMGLETCATAKLISLRATPAPAGVSADQWSEAVETAQGKVEALTDTAGTQIETAARTFEKAVETAADNGTPLPTLTALDATLNAIYDPAHPLAGVCAQINAVTATVQAPTVTPPSTGNTDEQGDHQTEQKDKNDNDKNDQHGKPEPPKTQHHDNRAGN
ncbi:MAG TPA: hypothetical protein VET65_01990 [Candidatus Limnocylindrales bacterium]|nr:hypothetical protein [Candidatus Limnocylindrales bacterium]